MKNAMSLLMFDLKPAAPPEGTIDGERKRKKKSVFCQDPHEESLSAYVVFLVSANDYRSMSYSSHSKRKLVCFLFKSRVQSSKDLRFDETLRTPLHDHERRYRKVKVSIQLIQVNVFVFLKTELTLVCK